MRKCAGELAHTRVPARILALSLRKIFEKPIDKPNNVC